MPLTKHCLCIFTKNANFLDPFREKIIVVEYFRFLNSMKFFAGHYYPSFFSDSDSCTVATVSRIAHSHSLFIFVHSLNSLISERSVRYLRLDHLRPRALHIECSTICLCKGGMSTSNSLVELLCFLIRVTK